MTDFDDSSELDLGNEMEALQPYVSPTATKEEVIRKLENCPVCGSQLHFTYFADFAHMATNEVARCNECNYRSRKGLQALV